jgi:hypothetical protein
MRGGLGLYGPLESRTPRHDAGRKAKTRQPQAAPTPDGEASVPPNAGPRADCATATPSRRAVHGSGATYAFRRTAVVGARAASQALLGARTVARLPAPPGSPNEWLTQSRPARRHRGNGEPIRLLLRGLAIDHSELPETLGRAPIRSHLVHELVESERALAESGVGATLARLLPRADHQPLRLTGAG